MTFNLSSLKEKALQVYNEGYLKHYKEAFKNASGAVTISKIAAEAISILILIVVLVLIPLIGSSVEDNMPAINSTSAWKVYEGGGASTWGVVQPLLTVCVIVAIIALVLKVIYDLKQKGN